ncbi:TolB family protein [Actomonas aquatica]|uniref:Biopolymer transporter TolR n=1 Tax=Actomonas aquatica TaxID=2866162 RepID=A0ABZ1C3F3_9BACT|nr:biopolymer transporter TolR [Opitutus sp. WL0086]WRQ85882.1 biopolymer transporter TolR [Opitutus sp. WL0086]
MNASLLRPRSLLMCAFLSSSALFAGSPSAINQRAHGPAVGDFAHTGDVGDPAIPGSTRYDPITQTYHLAAAGTNLWGERDEFHFAWNQIEGDFILRARVKFLGEGVDPHRKLGWMVRSDLDAGSVYVDGTVHGSGLTSLQFRAAKNGETNQIIHEAFPEFEAYPDVIQLERRGNTFIFSAAHFGEPLQAISTADVAVDNVAYAGLFLCAHNPEVVEQAVFSDVRLIKPAPLDFHPYRDYIGSRLEILDVHTGERTQIFESAEAFEAPNWTTDGLKLIVNVSGNSPDRGKLRTFDLATRRIETLNTGAIVDNNNDHVLSHDGTMLAISSFAGDHKSTVYTLPVTGSDAPEQITDPAWGHSFLHGWSLDKKWIVYTAERNGQWDIWKVNVETKQEEQVTDVPTLDDGSEFSPDGEWIYFNSTRTGLMQIWKMRPDGSEQQQVFEDGWQNWFPHLSPDGKWMTMISYDPAVVAAGDHPYYKHTMLRLMPVDGSAPPKVIAYVYGGQGTINVPSWSPDSRKIAFVSNSDVK